MWALEGGLGCFGLWELVLRSELTGSTQTWVGYSSLQSLDSESLMTYLKTLTSCRRLDESGLVLGGCLEKTRHHSIE